MAMRDPSSRRATAATTAVSSARSGSWLHSRLYAWFGAASALAIGASGSVARADEASKEPAASGAAADVKTVDAAELKAAPSDQPPADQAEWEREKATRRSGVTIGLQGNIGLGMASGYPLDLKKIGRASYYTQTSVGLGAMGIFWVGVSLKDWLAFGVGASIDGLLAGDKSGWGPGGLFRIEGFPLWPLGGIGKEIGATFDAGASAISVQQKDHENNLIDGGAASYLGGGVFYEGIRFWHVSSGPGVYAGYMWSDTVRHGTVSLSYRLTFYSGSAVPEKKKVSARR